MKPDFISHSILRGARLLCSMLLLGVAACSPSKNEVRVSMDQVSADLRILSDARIFFGHQSVGGNILRGVEVLSREAGVPLRIVELTVGAPAPPGAGIFHVNVGANGSPESKVDDFEASLDASGGAAYDAAVLKFCYVDLDENSAPGTAERVLSRYQAAVTGIRTAHTGTTLIHTTMPIMSDPPGMKTSIKRLLGKSTWRDEANARRASYNASIRSLFGGGELFDIAQIESSGPDGKPRIFETGGRQVETMAQEYTSDGGHLNDAGQRHIAAAFLHSLAAAISRQKNPVPKPAGP